MAGGGVSTPVKFLIAWAICVAGICYGALGQSSKDSYCFQFTWLGPKYTNESNVNGTCEDLGDRVCANPLVYTYDGTPPNLTNMWLDSDIRSRVSCKLTKGEVCARWTYTYNNEFENVTYLCTKVTVDGRTAKTSGCELQVDKGRVIEVCACQTSQPDGLPCNDALSVHGATAPLLLLALLVSVALRR